MELKAWIDLGLDVKEGMEVSYPFRWGDGVFFMWLVEILLLLKRFPKFSRITFFNVSETLDDVLLIFVFALFHQPLIYFFLAWNRDNFDLSYGVARILLASCRSWVFKELSIGLNQPLFLFFRDVEFCPLLLLRIMFESDAHLWKKSFNEVAKSSTLFSGILLENDLQSV